jgi:hypothetical protein
MDVIKCEVGLQTASLNKPQIHKFINETQFLTMNYTLCQSPFYDATDGATVESSPIFVPRTSVHISLALKAFRHIQFPFNDIALKLSATAYLTCFTLQRNVQLYYKAPSCVRVRVFSQNNFERNPIFLLLEMNFKSHQNVF